MLFGLDQYSLFNLYSNSATVIKESLKFVMPFLMTSGINILNWLKHSVRICSGHEYSGESQCMPKTPQIHINRRRIFSLGSETL